MTLSGITSRDAADGLVGRYLEVDARPLRAKVSYYWHQLVGLAVGDPAGRELGHVVGGIPGRRQRGLPDRGAATASCSLPAVRRRGDRDRPGGGPDGRRLRRRRGSLTEARQDRCASTSSPSFRSSSTSRCGPRSSDAPPSAACSSSPSTTCASTASGGIGPSTISRTAGEPAWSCAPSRCSRPSTPLRDAGAHVVLLDPAGERLTDALARELATLSRTWRSSAAATRESTSACARFVDREVQHRRLRPDRRRAAGTGRHRRGGAARPRRDRGGVPASATRSPTGLLEFPQYTRPERLRGLNGAGHPAVGQPWRGGSLAAREALRRTLGAAPTCWSTRRCPADRADDARWRRCASGTADSSRSGPRRHWRRCPGSRCYTPPVAAASTVAFACAPRRRRRAQKRR